MRKIKQILLTGILVCAMLLSGCNPMHKDVETSDSWADKLEELKTATPDQAGSHIRVTVSEKIDIDADILVPEQLTEYKAPVLKVKRHFFTDKEKLLDVLMKDFIISNPSSPKKRNTDYYFEDGKEETELSMEDANGSFVDVRDSKLGGYSQTSKLEQLIAIDMIGEQVNPYTDWLQEDGSLDFLSVDDFRDKVQTLLEQLGLEQDFQMKIYAGGQEGLEKIADDINRFHEEVGLWTKEDFISVSKADEEYEAVLYQQYQGIPFCYTEVSMELTNSTYGVCSLSEMRYQADGFSDISINNIFDVVEESDSSAIISIGEVLEKYSQRVMQANAAGQKETLLKIQLQYLPVYDGGDSGTFTVKPVWYLASVTDKDDYPQRMVYDAVTGEMLQ